MQKGAETFIEDKTEEILSSPSYKDLDESDKNELREEIKAHLERMVIEIFINRLSSDQAKELNKLARKDGKRALRKLREFSFSSPDLAKDLEETLNKEVEKFKSLKS